MTEKRKVNELEVAELCGDIAFEIRYDASDGPSPSRPFIEMPIAIIAPVRGGLIPGVYMSHLLGIPLFPINYSLRDHKADLEIPTSFYHYVLNHTGNTVLLIYDIVDTGETFRGIQEAFENFDGINLLTSTLYHNIDAQNVNVDYSGEQLSRSDDKRWYDFYWEKS